MNVAMQGHIASFYVSRQVNTLQFCFWIWHNINVYIQKNLIIYCTVASLVACYFLISFFFFFFRTVSTDNKKRKKSGHWTEPKPAYQLGLTCGLKLGSDYLSGLIKMLVRFFRSTRSEGASESKLRHHLPCQVQKEALI